MEGYRLGFRGDIEGLRAVAILLVVAAHASVPWLAGGFIGVDVFFVLSGFLITGLLQRELAEQGRIDFGAFYIRRLRRLLPALLLVVLVVSAVAFRLLAPWDQGRQASAAAMASVWLSNIHFALAKLDYFAPGTEANLFLHTWSLGVEEQFYLLWPALLMGVWLLAKRNARSFKDRGVAVLLAVACASLVAELVLSKRFPQWAFYMMPTRAWQFAAGGLIWALPAMAGEAKSSVRRYIAASLGWVGLALIIGTALCLNGAVPYPGWRAVIPTLGAALVIYAGMPGSHVLSAKFLASRPLQGIGRISYAWYLWHWPALLLGGFALDWVGAPLLAVEVLASLVLAVLTYRYVETPLRHRRGWLTYRHAALLASVGLMAAMSMGAVLWRNQATAASARPDVMRYAKAYKDTPAIYPMGCDDWYKAEAVKFCSFGPTDAEHTAVLMGDSIAGQWSPAMIRAFNRAGWRLLVVTKSSCPMVDESFFYERIRREFTECTHWRSAALELIAEMKPDLLLLSNASNYGFTQSQWVDGTARVLQAVAGPVKRVVVLRATPGIRFDGPSCLATHIGKLDACGAPYRDPQADRVFAWQQEASARFGNASTLDFNDLICPDATCKAAKGGQVVFRDSQHMTASFAESLGDAVTARLGIEAAGATAKDSAR
ncbi:acyltransferase family protein [Dyella sp. 2RAB6]|uniref:acyltransferase family protein n=1 Tax=Dyella sp. 2RAB6 TaxID=3232992 RepID=UPI003F92E14D